MKRINLAPEEKALLDCILVLLTLLCIILVYGGYAGDLTW